MIFAVIKFKNEDNKCWEITYKTPISCDVLGYLSSKDVSNKLQLIKSLNGGE